MKQKKEFIPSIAMSIHAHPDDQEFTVAGTLASWSKQGTKIISVIVTSGESGSNDALPISISQRSLAKIREAEQRSADEILGIQETVFMHYHDGELEPTMRLRKDITRLLRKHKPDTLIIGDPQGVFYGNGYIIHPDHRAAAQAALYAAFPSSETRLIFPELIKQGLYPHKIGRIFIHGSEKPDTWVNITETIEEKIIALKKHTSQLGKWEPGKMIREWAKEEAKGHGVKYAEAFKVMLLLEPEEGTS